MILHNKHIYTPIFHIVLEGLQRFILFQLNLNFQNLHSQLNSEENSFIYFFTSSNCSHEVAISGTGTANLTVHACDMPIGLTCKDIETHCTVDKTCYQIPISLKTHHNSLNLSSLSSDPIEVSGHPTRFSSHCTSW